MRKQTHKPLKADEGEAIGALILVVLAVAAGVFVAVLVAGVVIAVGPTAGGIYWWSCLNQRYQISKRKKVAYALACAGLLMVPVVVMAMLAPQAWYYNRQGIMAAIWLGALLGLCGTALFFSLAAYRQVFWPHHKIMLAERWKASIVRLQLWRARQALEGFQRTLTRKEQNNQHLVREQRELAQKVNQAILAGNTAFYSAERLRWQREYAAMSTEDLMQRRASLNKVLARTPQKDPRGVTLALEAAVVRLEAQDRLLGGKKHGSYREALKKHEEKAEVVTALQRRLQSIQETLDTRRSAIQALRRTRPTVN